MIGKESGVPMELTNMDIVFRLEPFTYEIELDANITVDDKPIVVTRTLDLKELMECHNDYDSLVDEDSDRSLIILEIPDGSYGITIKSKVAMDKGYPVTHEETYSHREIMEMRRRYLELDPNGWLRATFHLTPLFKEWMESGSVLSWEEYRKKYKE